MTYTDFILSFCTKFFVAVIEHKIAFQDSFIQRTRQWLGVAIQGKPMLVGLTIEVAERAEIRGFFDRVVSI